MWLDQGLYVEIVLIGAFSFEYLAVQNVKGNWGLDLTVRDEEFEQKFNRIKIT